MRIARFCLLALAFSVGALIGRAASDAPTLAEHSDTPTEATSEVRLLVASD